jgi:hypothetical protein
VGIRPRNQPNAVVEVIPSNPRARRLLVRPSQPNFRQTSLHKHLGYGRGVFHFRPPEADSIRHLCQRATQSANEGFTLDVTCQVNLQPAVNLHAVRNEGGSVVLAGNAQHEAAAVLLVEALKDVDAANRSAFVGDRDSVTSLVTERGSSRSSSAVLPMTSGAGTA